MGEGVWDCAIPPSATLERVAVPFVQLTLPEREQLAQSSDESCRPVLLETRATVDKGKYMSKASDRKEALHGALIQAAEERIAAHGVGKLRARDLAADVKCSVGAIYNVFADIDAIILHVSFRTLQRIDDAMEKTGAEHRDGEPVTCMVCLAWTYFELVQDNYNLWRALFDHTMPDESALSDGIGKQVTYRQNALFQHIEKPLGTYLTGNEDVPVKYVARSLFASVHGIVSLSMEGRASGISMDAVPEQLEFLLRTFVAGLVKPAP